MTVLPSIPSQLIRLAIKDLKLVEQDNNYEVNMGYWHSGTNNREQCQVCLAGSVMAKTLETPSSSPWFPEKTGENYYSIAALDRFRLGYINLGLQSLNYIRQIRDKFKTSVSVTFYAYNSSQFKADMLDMADQFERAGL